MKSNWNSKRKSRSSSRNAGLLGDLVASRFFQILIGNAPIVGRWEPEHTPSKNKKQSIPSKIVDVGLFSILVVVAPILTVSKWLTRTIKAYWWIKFCMGIVTGCCCMIILYKILEFVFATHP